MYKSFICDSFSVLSSLSYDFLIMFIRSLLSVCVCVCVFFAFENQHSIINPALRSLVLNSVKPCNMAVMKCCLHLGKKLNFFKKKTE